MPGPKLLFSENLHSHKYRLPGESFSEGMRRLARGLADNPRHEHALVEVFEDMRFMAAGRVQAAIGSPKNVTPYNCYVSGTIADSFVHDGDASIMGRAMQAAATMRMGGGIGYDFSTLRPNGAMIHGVKSTTDGPLAFMPIFDATCQATSSAGNRRGAQMGVLRIDHPDIRAFLRAKQGTGKLTGFNLSVGVTDEFMHALASGRPFDLRFNGEVFQTVDPVELWEEVMLSTWDYAEPGVLFIDTINRMNNLYYCETIAATNPCGEQPLPPFGACLLGSFNLVRYLRSDLAGYWFDWAQFCEDIPHVVRAMDNVVDQAMYPLPEQEVEAKSKRRMGLGVTGLANAGEALGFVYGSAAFIEFEAYVLRTLREQSYQASAWLADEKGAFPLYDEDAYLDGQFVKTLSPETRELIRRNGIRNSHLTSIAPTGTISFTADYISSSIEPVFGFEQADGSLSYEGRRKVNMPEGQIEVDVSDYGFRELGVAGKFAQRVTAKEHVDVLVTAATLVDSAVSKTCNVDGSMPWADFKGIYQRVWERGGKGCTTFNKDGKLMGIMVAPKAPEEPEVVQDGASCTFDPETGRRSCE